MRGDAEYFANNYERYFYYALSITKDIDDAQDIMQDSFIRIHNSQNTWENKNVMVSRHLAFAYKDHARFKNYYKRTQGRLKVSELTDQVENLVEAPVLEEPYLSEKMENALKKTKFGNLFYMHVVDEKTQVELSKEVGVSCALICLRISETKKQLQEILQAA